MLSHKIYATKILNNSTPSKYSWDILPQSKEYSIDDTSRIGLLLFFSYFANNGSAVMPVHLPGSDRHHFYHKYDYHIFDNSVGSSMDKHYLCKRKDPFSIRQTKILLSKPFKAR